MAKNQKRETDLTYRAAPLALRADGPVSVDEDTRSVEVVLSTENPVTVYDYNRGPIQEVLLMDGAKMPRNKRLVLLDAHSRYTTADVIGSAREITTENGEMTGRAYFSAEAESVWTKVREGHLTDFSIGYRVDETEWIPAGKREVIGGREFSGPVQVVTKWTPRELSAVPIGADQEATARSEHNNNQEEYVMDEKIRTALEGMGLPKTATDEEAILFLGTLRHDSPPVDEGKRDEELEKARKEATGAGLTRIKEIDKLCGEAGLPDMARELILEGVSLQDAQRKVMDELIKRAKDKTPGTNGLEVGTDEKDKFRAAANDGLILRAGYRLDTPAAGASDLRGLTLPEMARECLRMAGQPHRGNVKDMTARAMTSSDFPYILANLATKSMQEAWATAQETWGTWCSTGSVADFKTYYDQAMSEHDDLELVPDAGEIPYGSFSEKKPETYQAAQYSKKFRITRVMIVNDDLNALTEMPARRAEAAARKVGDVAYAVLTTNAAMADTEKLFSAAHSNQAVSALMAEPGVTNIAAGILAMGTHKDIKGLRRLNIRPEYFIAPKALEGVAEVFFRSEKFSDHSTVATDSSFASNRVNPYSGSYFTRVYEPRLDDAETATWYLAGPKGKTVKVVFLNGVQAPILEVNQPGFSIEGLEYLVSIDCGAYAVDYRGLYKNEGK